MRYDADIAGDYHDARYDDAEYDDADYDDTEYYDTEYYDGYPVRPRRPVPWRQLGLTSCWVLTTIWSTFAFVRVFGLERTYPVDIFMAFTPYMTVLSAIPLLLALVLRRRLAAIIAAATSLALVTVLVPRMIGHPDAGTGPVLRVMSMNMKIGAADPRRIVALVVAHRVDLLALQEFTPTAQSALIAAGLGAALRYSAQSPDTGAVGSAIFSRYPLRAAGYAPFPGGFGQEYATVSVPGALPVFVESVHPCAPSEPARTRCWTQGLADEPAATAHGPVRLLIGDFNSTMDHVWLRNLLGTGYRDVASQLGDGLTPTWPYDGRPIPVVTVDHILADPRIGVASFRVDRVSGTDHRSIFASLTLPPG